MPHGKTLLLTFADDLGLGAAVQATVALARQGEFQLEEERLPATAAASRDLEPVFRAVLTRLSPAVVILATPQTAQPHAASILRLVRQQFRLLPVLVVLDSDRPEDAGTLLELGASDFVVPPLRGCDFLPRLRRLQPVPDRRDSTVLHPEQRFSMSQLIGESSRFTEVVGLLPKLARSDASVFIMGETGTGKELFARALHELSPRARRPFIAVNCGAIPAELMENELFGHERGAFTGATAAVRGLIHDADHGTLLLDEIDSLPPPTQVKLLRFLQDHTYRPLGARGDCQADVRIVAAANTNLEEAARAGRFRADLYYRIHVLTLTLPPLRERRDDIPLLARHFIGKYARQASAPPPDLSPAAQQTLCGYDWPGNVRELENVIHRAVVLCEHPTLRREDIFLPVVPDHTPPATFKALKARAVVDFEKAYLQRILTAQHGNITRAAQAAGKDRRAFWQLLRKHNLHLHPPASCPPSVPPPRPDIPGLR